MMKINYIGRNLISKILTTSGILATILLSWDAASAQITTDGTLNTSVSQSANNFTISNGSTAGNNLFHSFNNFSVPTGSSATFDLTNTPNITTIFSRVTGGNVSHIDGLIQTLNGSNPVNLFLLNPSGIVFGPSANLNIGGSFIATTANSVIFADGWKFNATNTTAPLLTISVPVGLQFSPTPGSIEVKGQGNDGKFPTSKLGIIGSPGKTIALVGGDIKFDGGVITAPGGRIEVGAVTNGTVDLTATPAGWQLGYTQVADFGNINLTENSSLWNPDPVGNPFGGIQVVGKDIALNQSQIAAAVTGAGQGGDITVNAARSLSLSRVNANAQAPLSTIFNSVLTGATANGGAVNIQAPQVTLQDGSVIETLSLGAGKAGKVTVWADTVSASGAVRVNTNALLALIGSSNSRISSETFASGDGGDVTVIARQLTFKGSGAILTAVYPGATGRGGNIFVNAAEDITAIAGDPLSFTPSGIGAYTIGIGNGGNIDVSTGTLHLFDGGEILAPSVRLAGVPGTGVGNTGDITVVARQSIKAVGAYSLVPTLTSGIANFTTGSGNSGNVSVTTPNLTLEAGSLLETGSVPVFSIIGDVKQGNNLGNAGNLSVSVSEKLTITGINQFTQSPTALGSSTLGNGKAGDVTVKTNKLVIQDGGSINTFTAASGNAGTLNLQANDILIEGQNIFSSTIAGSAPIVSKTSRQIYGLPNAPSGNAGKVSITTNNLTVRDNANVSLINSGTGNAGELSIQANQISLDNSRIQANTASGQGGDIKLDVANNLLLRHSSAITTAAGGSGNGGNITINAPIIVGVENSDIIANAIGGRGGNIQISTWGIIGFESRNLVNPREIASNDITASSEFNINGTVQINNVGIDPSSGLVELPINLTNPSQQIATGCLNNTNSSFVATGRGGIPQNPSQQIGSDRTWSDIRDLSAYRNIQTVQIPLNRQEARGKRQEDIVQATSWRRNAQGKVELIAAKSAIALPLTCAAVPKS